jgi:hypothetical protein
MALILPKSMFLHIPKTGGIWVRNAIKKADIDTFEYGEQHSHFDELLKYRDKQFYENRFIFTFIRHPLSWYQSRWAFRMKHGWQMRHPLDFNCASNNFCEFVKNCIEYKPAGWVSWLYGSFINKVPGEVFVGKQENLSGDLISALHDAGEIFDEQLITDTDRANVSDMYGKSSKDTAVYTVDLIDKVLDVEKSVINKYYSDINPSSLYQQYSLEYSDVSI